jgi:hypothetical protein
LFTVGLIKRQHYETSYFIGEAFLVNGFITLALKKAVKRDRPFETTQILIKFHLLQENLFLHTSLAFSRYLLVWPVIPNGMYIALLYLGKYLAIPYAFRVHYPSDVVAGAIIGSGSAYLTYKVNKWINKK